MLRFRELYGSMSRVVIPRVLLEYSGQRVITSEWIDGQKVRRRISRVSEWINGQKVRRRVSRVLNFRQDTTQAAPLLTSNQ